VFTSLYSSDDNVLVCAPTGSGKTTCAEFALLRLYSKHAEGSLVGVRAVYMGPNEALVTQRYKDWAARFGTLGVNVVMLTGESAADLKLLVRKPLPSDTTHDLPRYCRTNINL
jgi:pre-mRNA-splicing helicase BRR2